MYCENCGGEFERPVANRCPHCGTRVADAAPGAWVPPPPATGGRGGGGGGVPWEDASLPFLERLGTTIKEVVVNPVGFFSSLSDDPIGPPLLYGFVILMVPALLGLLIQVLFQGAALMAGLATEGGEALPFGLVMVVMVVVSLIFVPVAVVIGLFLHAGIAHLLLLLVGDGQRGFPVTFRVVCYSATPSLLSFLPCVGFLAGIWSLVLLILGAIYAHQTDAWRSVVALLVIPILCVGSLFLVFLLFIVGMIGAAQGG